MSGVCASCWLNFRQAGTREGIDVNQTATALLAIALSLALSFFMSGMEAGVFALSRLRIRQLMRAGKPRVVVVYEQCGSHPVLFWAIFAIGGFLFYAVCELLPKLLFRMFPNRLCLALVGPFRLVHATLAPIVSLLDRFSHRLLRWSGGRTFTGRLFGNRVELRLVMQESAQAFTSEERSMINRVLDLQHLTVGHLTTPLQKVVTASTETAMIDVLRLCRERNLTRLPVWRNEETQRRIAGVLSLKTLLYQSDFDASKIAGDYVEPALYLNEETRLEEALRRMQRSGQRLGIVLGRDQRELGIISLQDVLKFVFGEVSL